MIKGKGRRESVARGEGRDEKKTQVRQGSGREREEAGYDALQYATLYLLFLVVLSWPVLYALVMPHSLHSQTRNLH